MHSNPRAQYHCEAERKIPTSAFGSGLGVFLAWLVDEFVNSATDRLGNCPSSYVTFRGSSEVSVRRPLSWPFGTDKEVKGLEVFPQVR